MKFAIYREVLVEGKSTRKIYVEWDKNDIIAELTMALGCDVTKAFNSVIEKFKQESIKIP